MNTDFFLGQQGEKLSNKRGASPDNSFCLHG
jgi:hypothetical protein